MVVLEGRRTVSRGPAALSGLVGCGGWRASRIGDAPPAFLPSRPITRADLAALTERVRRRVIRWFRMRRLLDAAAAAEMLAWENSGFSVDASVRITLIDRDVPSYFRSLEHLLRYCARPPFALERLSVMREEDGRITRVRYVLPRHKAANWVGPGRGRKSTRPGATGVVELTPFEFLNRLADLVPPPRKHRHRYHGVFAPNHKLRRAVTALAIGNIGKRGEAGAGGHAGDAHATGCCDTQAKPRSHDTSRIAWAKLLARQGEEFPLHCPNCGGDIRLIAFITEPTPIRKILTHLGERWGQCQYLRKSGQGVFQQPRPPLLSPSALHPIHARHASR